MKIACPNLLFEIGPLAEKCAFLVEGYVAGGTAVTVARCNVPKQFLQDHHAGHGDVTSPHSEVEKQKVKVAKAKQVESDAIFDQPPELS